MAIDKKTIINLLEYLDAEITVLEKSRVTKATLNDEENRLFTDATKHRIQIAVEIVINISEHIVAGLNLGKPEFAKELFSLLAQEKIIDLGLSKKLGNAVGLRNILVHMYREVDLGILADSATAGLNDLRQFAKAVNELLAKP